MTDERPIAKVLDVIGNWDDFNMPANNLKSSIWDAIADYFEETDREQAAIELRKMIDEFKTKAMKLEVTN